MYDLLMHHISCSYQTNDLSHKMATDFGRHSNSVQSSNKHNVHFANVLAADHKTLHMNRTRTESLGCTDRTVLLLLNSEATCFFHRTRQLLQKLLVRLVCRNINTIEAEKQHNRTTKSQSN